MFLGESTHSLDAKFRLFLPKRFQKGVGRDEEDVRGVVLTRGLDGCVFLFSAESFVRALERLDTQPFAAEEEKRNLQRMFFANAHEVQLDASGRLLIPEKLRKQAGIDKDVALVGVVDRIEIWARDRWEGFEDANEHLFQKVGAVLAGESNRGTPNSTPNSTPGGAA